MSLNIFKKFPTSLSGSLILHSECRCTTKCSSPGESLSCFQGPLSPRVDVDGACLAGVVGPHLSLEPRGKRLQGSDQGVVKLGRGNSGGALIDNVLLLHGAFAPLDDRHCAPTAERRVL